MGGAAEIPDRASSPLKRRASSMDPDAELDAKEDVDMVSATLSPPPTTTANSSAASPTKTHDVNGTQEVEVNGLTEPPSDETMPDRPSPPGEEPAISAPKTLGKYFG